MAAIACRQEGTNECEMLDYSGLRGGRARAARRIPGPGRGLAEQDGAPDHPVLARRQHRFPGPHPVRAHEPRIRAAVRHRLQARGGEQHRRGRARAQRARRLHARLDHRGLACDQPDAVRKDAVRPHQGFRAGVDGRHLPEPAGGQQRFPGAHHSRADRGAEEESGQIFVCLVRARARPCTCPAKCSR